MVMVRLGPGITDINGIVGGDIFRRDRCGLHKQKTPGKKIGWIKLPQNIAFTKCCKAWYTRKWLEWEISMWWNWVKRNPFTNKKGERYYISAFNAFLHINVPRVLNGLRIRWYPPTT